MATNLQACSPNDETTKPEVPEENNGNNGSNGSNGSNPDDNGNGSSNNSGTYQVKITFGKYELTATFEDNATTKAFREKLPLTLPMLDLYSREMCYRFPDALPANEAKTRGYEVGEIIYYPPMHSFVIMYKQNGERFNMQNMGRIDSDVEKFINIGNIDVRFELITNE
jgi:hypothetical protein